MDARPAPLTHLLYLHGFRSSPQSFKARMIAAQVDALNRASPPEQAITWWCPQLPPSPDEAVAQVLTAAADWPRERMAIIGSSLGGFYATVLGERLGCRVAVINPAVAPARDLARYIGEQTSFHNPEDRFFFRPEFVPAFAALHPYPITRPERYWALIAQGDEIILERYWGGADTTTPHLTFSFHKTVSALLVGTAIADGHVGTIDASIGDYIKEWANDPRGKPSLRSAMQMSAGYAQPSLAGGPFSEWARFAFSSDIVSATLAGKAQLVAGKDHPFEYLELDA